MLSTVQKFGRLTSKKTGCDWGDHFISALSFLAKLPFCFTRNGASSPGRRKGLRQTASASETTSLICILTLPQLIMQVVVAALSDSTLETELDPTGNIGRVVCGQDEGWVLGAGIGYAAFVYMLAVTAAWVSRSLPSAFNEKDQVFHAATISTVLAFISISLLEIMNDPTTEPDVVVSRPLANFAIPDTYKLTHHVDYITGLPAIRSIDWGCYLCTDPHRLA